ncbi:MAG: cutinase family protein [Mycobacterium sp.]|uniref:cutinase family protein n=1 Tax=Mycobacterium sp. TaxID=1785 RepID=UPI003C4D5DF0
MNAFRIAHVARIVGAAIAMMSALLIGPAGSPPAHADPCPNVEVTFARGTSQQPGVGNVGQVFIDSLRSQIGGRSLGVYAVNYPGTFQFAQSAPIGANDVTGHVQDMVGRCPNTKLVLGGMSQGAGVIDMASTMIPPEAADHVAAVALFGNPKSMLATALSGGFPDISPLFAPKTIDMCAPDDPACSGGMNPQAHGSYVESGMAAQAATLVASRL